MSVDEVREAAKRCGVVATVLLALGLMPACVDAVAIGSRKPPIVVLREEQQPRLP